MTEQGTIERVKAMYCTVMLECITIQCSVFTNHIALPLYEEENGLRLKSSKASRANLTFNIHILTYEFLLDY